MGQITIHKSLKTLVKNNFLPRRTQKSVNNGGNRKPVDWTFRHSLHPFITSGGTLFGPFSYYTSKCHTAKEQQSLEEKSGVDKRKERNERRLFIEKVLEDFEWGLCRKLIVLVIGQLDRE